MKLTRENIEEYVERFLDGRTTCAEEQALYDYFRSETVPAEWEYLREAFAYFESGMSEEAPAEDSTRMPVQQPLRRSSMAAWRPPRRVVRWFAAASAAVVAAAGTWIAVSSQSDATVFKSPYDGSYMIFNGEYCNDIETMDYQIDIALERAAIMETKAAHLLAIADRQSECKTL